MIGQTFQRGPAAYKEFVTPSRKSVEDNNTVEQSPIDARFDNLVRVYKEKLSPEEQKSFAAASRAVDGSLFDDLSACRGSALKAFFVEHPRFGYHVAVLRELGTLRRIVSSDATRLQADWKPPSSCRKLVPVPTSHPTHSRTASMRDAYRQAYGYLAGKTPSLEPSVLDGLLPPANDKWKKPSLVDDEMPMMAAAIANQALALWEELYAQSSEQARRDLLNSTARPEVWGAYDQDGHPDTRPGFMLLQRAHLRYAMWSAYAVMAQREGMPQHVIDRISITREYWGRVKECLWHRTQSAEGLQRFENIEGYPDAPPGKLGGPDDSERTETKALLELIDECSSQTCFRDVVERFGTSGAKGHFRFTAGGARGLWATKEGDFLKTDPGRKEALLLRFHEINALQGDVGMVIIAECDDPRHVKNTVDLMAENQVPTWLDEPDGVIVMPLIEEANMAASTSQAIVDMLQDRQNMGRPLPREVHLMAAGSDLVNREGKVGQMLESCLLLRALLTINAKFPGVKVRLMEGVGGSSVRTGGAQKIVELRDAIRFMDDEAFSTSAITVQGIDADTQFATPESARARLRQLAWRPAHATSDPARLDNIIEFLEEMKKHVGRHEAMPMRGAPGFEQLYARGNPVIDGIMRNRRDGSRTPTQGTPSRGVGPEGERTISYVKMMRGTGGLQWHHDWREVPHGLMEQIRHAWRDPDHVLNPIVKVLIADMAVELTRVDLQFAEEVFFPAGLRRASNEADRVAFSAMCEAHKHLCEFLRSMGIYKRGFDADLLFPDNELVRKALLEELGLPDDADDKRLETALRARRGETRLQAYLLTGSIEGRDEGEKCLNIEEAYMLQFAGQRRNPYDGVGASDLDWRVLTAFGAHLHHSASNIEGPSMMLPDGTIITTRAGELQLGEGLAAHEQYHLDSGRAKETFFSRYGEDFYAELRDDAQHVADEEKLLMLRDELIQHVTEFGPQTDEGWTIRHAHAEVSRTIADMQVRLTEDKLRKLADVDAGRANDARGLALEFERARQREKYTLAACAATVIASLSPMERPDTLKSTRVVIEEAGLRNEAQHLLFELSGGLVGVPSHMVTLKTTEDIRDFAHALDEQDFGLLRECLPDACADVLLAVESASREAASHRAALLASLPDVSVVKPFHRRLL